MSMALNPPPLHSRSAVRSSTAPSALLKTQVQTVLPRSIVSPSSSTSSFHGAAASLHHPRRSGRVSHVLCGATEREADWRALASTRDEEYNEEADPDFVKSFNEMCNEAVKVMMKDDIQATLKCRDNLSQVGQFFSAEGNKNAATFVYVLYHMMDHTLVKQGTELTGIYLKAFEKIFNIIEDSGWKLESEENDEDEEPGTRSLERAAMSEETGSEVPGPETFGGSMYGG